MDTPSATRQSNSPLPWASCATVEDVVDWLRSNTDVEVMAKVQPTCVAIATPRSSSEREAMIVDVEATFPDRQGQRHIRSVGLVIFRYDAATGRLGQVTLSITLTPHASVAGHWHVSSQAGMTGLPSVVTAEQVAAWLADCEWVVSHHAEFDRPLVESVFPAFCSKPWACSHRGIDWRSHGIRCAKLEYLAMRTGHWYVPHDAETDCHALLAVLASEVPEAPRTWLDILIKAETPDTVVVKMGPTPYVHDARERGYRRNGDWLQARFDVASYQRELPALRRNLHLAFSFRPHSLHRIGATDRYSCRPGTAIPTP